MSICYIDINDACNLRCPTCVRGVGLMPGSARKMDKKLFEEIINKAKVEGYTDIGLYNWTEPFLNDEIPYYISMIKKVGLPCEISTNLSFPNRTHLIKEALVAGIDRLIVSISGYSQEIYEINHRGGNLDYVKSNLEYISNLRAKEIINTEIYLRFIKFPYNINELPLAQKYATSLGIHLHEHEGAGSPYRPVNTYCNEDIIQELINNAYENKHQPRKGVCPVLMNTLAINVIGKVFICCAQPSFRSLEIGNYLDMTKDEIFLKRLIHPICSSCTYPRRKLTKSDYDALRRYKNLHYIFRNIDNKDQIVSQLLDFKSGRFTQIIYSRIKKIIDAINLNS